MRRPGNIQSFGDYEEVSFLGGTPTYINRGFGKDVDYEAPDAAPVAAKATYKKIELAPGIFYQQDDRCKIHGERMDLVKCSVAGCDPGEMELERTAGMPLVFCFFGGESLLSKLRNTRNQHWKGLDSQAIQDITDRVERGYRLFFNALKTGNTTKRPPSFRKRAKYSSVTFKQSGYKYLQDNRIRIGKHVYKFHFSREILGTTKTLTIKRDALGDIYLCFSCLLDKEKPEVVVSLDKMAGFDVGFHTFLYSSDDKEYKMPLHFKAALKKVRRAHKALSSKKKGSNSRKRAKLHLARVYRRIRRLRRESHLKLANRLLSTYDALFFEDLDLEGLRKRYGRKINDLGIASFIDICKHQATKKGKYVGQIDRYEPSSKKCSDCGWINEHLQLRDRSWNCIGCQRSHHRDFNAAKNVYRVGTSTLKVDDIRLLRERSLLDLRIPQL
jgi:putative transposase